MQKKFVGNPLVFQKSSGMEENYEKNGGIMIFCRESSVSLRGGNVVFTKTLVWYNFLNKTGFHVSPSGLFCLTVPQDFVGEPFVFQNTPGMEKKL